MIDCYITFRSITRAQKGSRLLESAGIHHQMLRTPKIIADQGCGYALRVRRDTARMAVEALRQNEIVYQRVYIVYEFWPYEEIQL